MNAELRIRAMSPADIPAVLALAESLATAPHWPQGTYEFALNPANLPQRIALLAAVPDGAPAGFAIASITGFESELETIAVATVFQRQGVARGLFARLAAQLAMRDVQTVFLEVRASNGTAWSFLPGVGLRGIGTPEGLLCRSARGCPGLPHPARFVTARRGQMV